jgi:hypothetical protein
MYINDDNNLVPEKTIVFYNQKENTDYKIDEVVESLKGKIKRDFFTEPFYYCLPLTIANQYGFVIKSAFDIELYWTGDESPVHYKRINTSGQDNLESVQSYFNNFKNGILSIENAFILRTPPGVNTMVMQPPNYFIPGVIAMNGVVETDNLRRSFTFNLKMTEPNKKVKIKKGDWLAAIMPVPRYFVDSFSLEPAEKFFSTECLNNEIEDIKKLSFERNHSVHDGGDIGKPNDSGRRYFKGIYANDESYKDHQKRI